MMFLFAATRPGRAWPRAAIMLLLTLLLACESPQEKEAKHYERGLGLYEEGQDEKAMVEFRNVLRLNPKNADALFHIGLIHERAERVPQAFAAFQLAVSERPEFVDAQIKFGSYALLAGQLDPAERAAGAIQQVDPKHPEALALRGAVALRKGQVQTAVDFAKAALEAEPQHENAITVLVGVDYTLGEYRGALTRLDEALAAHPESISLRQIKISILEKIDDPAQAVATYEELVALEPQNVDYRLALAGFYRQRAQFAEAKAVLRKTIDDGLVSLETADALVQLTYQQEGFAAAEAELKELIRRNPHDYQLRFRLSDFYSIDGQPEQAKRILLAIVEEAETNDTVNDARAGIARIELENGRIDSARRLVEDTLAQDSAHPEANLLRGTILLKEGKADDAIRSARTALLHDPEWRPGLRFLAEAYLAKGETRLAIDALGKVLSVTPEDVDSAELLATLLTQSGDYDAALKIWDHIVRIADTPAPALRARAAISIQQENWSAAEGDIERLLQAPGHQVAGAMLRGDLLLAQNRPQQAREWFERVETLQPKALGPTIGLVRSYLAEDDLQGALTYLKEKTEQNSEDATAFAFLGTLQARQGDVEAARQAFDRAILLEPDRLIFYRRLGKTLVEADLPAMAADVYQQALQRDENNLTILQELALAYMQAGQPDQAIQTYEHLLELKPRLDTAVNNYGALIADFKHDDPAALARALEAAERFRTSDEPQFLDTLGWLKYRENEFAVASALLQRAVALAPDEPLLRYHLGMALYRNGQTEQAITELEKATVEGVDYRGLAEARAVFKQLQSGRDPARATAGETRS